MFDELKDHEVELLVLALKYWRAHRLDTPTRRTDPVVTSYGIDLLLAKLQRNTEASLPRQADSFQSLPHR
jgi:hypothetical protein